MRRISLEKFAVELSDRLPWSNVYGLSRTLLALGTLSTFVFNDVDILFHHLKNESSVKHCYGLMEFSLFCLLQSNLTLAKGISIVVLLVVLIGWRPKITGIFHWWVSGSFFVSASVIDGGDQVTAIITFLLIPVCLTDKRTWHWSPEVRYNDEGKRRVFSIVSNSFLFMIKIQVAVVYFHSAVAKFRVDEWTNGTSLYYWFEHNVFGIALWARPLIGPLLSNEIFITLLTWSILLFEIILFGAIFMDNKKASSLLTVGILFHFGILLVHGLFSFFFAMSAALVLYLKDRPFALKTPAYYLSHSSNNKLPG